jgi:HEAT repeat protein
LAIEGPIAAAAAKKRLEDAKKPKPIDNAGVDAALGSIKQRDPFRMNEALRTLSEAAPIDARRADVVKALEGLISENDLFMRIEATKAMGRWARADDVPKLIKLLDDKNVFVRMSAIESLGLTNDERAAQALAAQMDDFETRLPATEALKSMGATAEKAVWPLLKHKNWETRISACQIIEAIGTDKSLDALAAVAQDENPLVVHLAADARRKIEERKK